MCGIGCGGGKAYDGSYAEYLICLGSELWEMPKVKVEGSDEMDWVAMGAIPAGVWTAWGSLFCSGETKDGDTVLIHGGTSSVGVWAILLAKSRGCKVLATTRQENKTARLLSAGADHVLLDFPESRLVEEVLKIAPKGVNTVLSLVGPDRIVDTAFQVLALHGTVITTGVLSNKWTMGDFCPLTIPPTRKMTFQ